MLLLRDSHYINRLGINSYLLPSNWNIIPLYVFYIYFYICYILFYICYIYYLFISYYIPPSGAMILRSVHIAVANIVTSALTVILVDAPNVSDTCDAHIDK